MNVISSSLWGDNPFYVAGAIRNARNTGDAFPGWTRIYYVDETVTRATCDALTEAGAIVVMCDDGLTGSLKMFRRFLAIDRPDVDAMIVRDTDSKLLKRDYDAVCEWMDSPAPLHIIRDAEAHNVPICGGMWGAKRGAFQRGIKPLIDMYLSTMLFADSANPRGCYHGQDQYFLWRVVWPMFASKHMAHIRHESELPEGKTLSIVPFCERYMPPLNGGSFVGQPE